MASEREYRWCWTSRPGGEYGWQCQVFTGGGVYLGCNPTLDRNQERARAAADAAADEGERRLAAEELQIVD